MTYRPPSTKLLRPMPADFPEIFVRGGWRMAERLLDRRTDVLVKWLEMAGSDRLKRLRREYLRGDVSAVERVRL